MDLQTLAGEYLQSARLAARRLETLREQLKTARGDEALDLRRRAELLRLELADLKWIARHLHDYYG